MSNWLRTRLERGGWRLGVKLGSAIFGAQLVFSVAHFAQAFSQGHYQQCISPAFCAGLALGGLLMHSTIYAFITVLESERRAHRAQRDRLSLELDKLSSGLLKLSQTRS
jgi:hypothetical protein